MVVKNAAISKDPAQLAKELNKFVTDAGGQEIPGLDKMDPAQLIKIRDGLKQFLDRFDDAARKDPEMAKLADGEAVKSLRSLAQLASQKVDDAALGSKHSMSGFCGGGAAPPPPPAPAPPPAAAAPPSPETAKPGPLSADVAGNRTLSADEVALGNQQVAQWKGQIDQQRATVVQSKAQLNNEIRALEAKGGTRTPAEEALLSGKRAQMSVLQGFEQNLALKGQGLDAAQFALKDGVLTASEQQDLRTIAQSVSNKDALLSQVGGMADQVVGRAQAMAAPFAGNGSNFDPMALNQVAAAAIMSSAMQSSGLAGVANPGANLGNLAALGNAQNLGLNNLFTGNVANSNQNVQRAGALSSPSQIGDDARFGPGADANLAALKSVGGGGGTFEDRVFAVMCKIVQDFQKQIEDRLEKLQQQAEAAEKDGGGGGGGGKGGMLGGIVGAVGGIAGSMVGGPIGGAVGSMAGKAVGGALGGGGGGGGAAGGDGKSGQESRNIEFEKIKYDMQKLSQMQQAMSNVLNSMDELAKSAIHHIKAG